MTLQQRGRRESVSHELGSRFSGDVPEETDAWSLKR